MMSVTKNKFGRKSIIALILLPIISLAVYAASCNNTGSSTGSVFSVTTPTGRITVGGGACNGKYWNVAGLNVAKGNLTLPEAGACMGSGTTEGKLIEATGNISTAPTIYGTFPAVLNGLKEESYNNNLYDLPAGDYKKVEIQNGAKVNILGPSTFKELKCLSQNGDGWMTFAPGNYYITTFSHNAGCNLDVQRDNLGNPIGKVILHFNSSVSISSGSCVNFSKDDCKKGDPEKVPSIETLARQHPEMMQIVVHSGEFSTQGAGRIAAGIFVENGTATLSSSTPTIIVGELLAQSISAQNNVGNIFYWKSTAGNAQGPVRGFSTIAPPAVPPVIKSGRDLAYIGAQKLEDNDTVSGHLSAYKLDAKAQLATLASWDAADLMTVSDRRSRLKTNLEITTKSTFTTINDATVPATPLGATAPASGHSNKEIIFDPAAYSGAYLGIRKSGSLIGRPWRTAPVIARTEDDKTNLVLFAADDGVLYAVNGTSGALVWGWVPKDILPLTAKPADLMAIHPWGQINYIQKGGSGYVVGTAMSGALHFSLKLDVDGNLDSIVWYDYVADGESPTVGKNVPLIGSSKEATDNLVGAAPGGDAPVQALMQNSSTQGLVAYIRNSQIYMRPVDTAGTPEVNGQLVHETFEVDVPAATAGAPATKTSVTAYPSTNLIFVHKNKLAFGDSYGQVKWFDPFVFDKDTKQVVFQSKQAVTKSASQLLGLTATTNSLLAGFQMTLIAYDKENVNMVKWKNDGSFAKGWHIGLDYSDTGLPKLMAGSVLSTVVHVSGKNLYIPFTIPPSDVSATCAPEGYAMGPLDINTGMVKTDKKYLFNDGAIVGADYISKFGQGEMQSLRSTRTAGAGATAYTVGVSNYGGAQASEGWGVYNEGAIGGSLKRILWRELTNY